MSEEVITELREITRLLEQLLACFRKAPQESPTEDGNENVVGEAVREE